ncbi:rolling circle replication-associated protein [Clostridium fungisolvens]|uniref:Replication-associated protein ORF2/G2P domain-containing protein n=1 Tax=Clostridium fungisolvens TaxID=1604897 RepID=A0A6V8SMU0_9CLOT|nr:hypothetical protein [Clostridium fungisolvens]GFP78564.1 hypothetical protein bsdtw1_04803 [Clostridium fungisolvens]
MSSLKSYEKKVVISGDIVEIYEYKNAVLQGYTDFKKSSSGRSVVASEGDKQVNRKKVMDRAKRDVRRLINANIGQYSKFVTLTFMDNVTDIKKANYEFKKFKQRLEGYLNHKLQYVAVIEFQKRGSIHYHVVMFNAPYIKTKKLGEIWGNGFVKINQIDKVDNVGAYVCKYMTKTDDERLYGEKMYFSSRGLEKPFEIKEKDRVDSLATSLPVSSLTYESTFTNEYNSVVYKQYNIKKANIEQVI